jgi:hypothetical protein
VTANKNGDDFGALKIEADKLIVYDDKNHPLQTFTVPGGLPNAPRGTPVAHMHKQTYEELVTLLTKLQGRDAHISKNCTAIGCPNALLCLTRKMVPGSCHACGKRWICDAEQNPLNTMEEFPVPEECIGYAFDPLQSCTACTVKHNVCTSLNIPPASTVEFDAKAGLVHVVMPIELKHISVTIRLGDE